MEGTTRVEREIKVGHVDFSLEGLVEQVKIEEANMEGTDRVEGEIRVG